MGCLVDLEGKANIRRKHSDSDWWATTRAWVELGVRLHQMAPEGHTDQAL